MTFKPEDMSEEQARATVDFLTSTSQTTISTYWFLIGILVGVCGNLATSGIIEMVKLHFPVL